MKTRLLKRLRREADKKLAPIRMIHPIHFSEFAEWWNYRMYMTYRENFILRRVAELKGKRKMKTNRLINECHCYNCRKYEECQTKGVFDDDPGFDFCVNYEDVSYPDDDNDEND